MSPSIAIVLPPKELFTAHYKGAVALCMVDFTRHSRFRDNTVLYSGHAMDLPDLQHNVLTGWQRWYLRDSYAWALRLAKLVKQRQHTHVEVQNRPLIFNYLTRLLKNTVQISLHLHNDPQGMHGARSPRQRQHLLDRASAIYCVSDYIRQRFCVGLQRGLEKVHVVHNGLDTRLFQPAVKQPQIAYVGRIIQEKGALPMAAAFASIADHIPDWQLVVCGVDRLETTSEYEKQTHTFLAKTEQQCRYTGYIDHRQVMQEFAHSAIALVPSVWQEPFGRTALEAMAAGTAIITSGSGGIAEIVGDSALIVPSEPVALAHAMMRLINDASLREKLQHAARLRAENQFDIRLLANQLDNLRINTC